MNISTALPPTLHPKAADIHVEKIFCPNCGSHHAEKLYSKHHHTAQIQCPTCDYFLLSCTRTGRVHESYAPGIAM